MARVGARPVGGVGVARPRLGFLGLGWIGLNRLAAVANSGWAEIVAVTDPNRKALENALETRPNVQTPSTLEDLIDVGLDGLVIATPSALHADQAIRALRSGAAVFCQKPLGRTRSECARVVQAARDADRLLGVDLSYRRVRAFEEVGRLVREGHLGEVHMVDLVFHNAYGPDREWFADRRLSGGGCVIDLGTHMLDWALMSLGWPRVVDVAARLYRNGSLLAPPLEEVEDLAVVGLDLEGGGSLRLACSWYVPAGRDAVIEARIIGRNGGASVLNVDGSFYDFRSERYRGTQTEVVVEPPDEWGGRAILDWLERLRRDNAYDPSVERYLEVAGVIDSIYGRTS